MNTNEIANQILSFVKENLVEDISIAITDHFNEIGIDSQSIIQIVLFIERNYNIQWEEKDLNKENLKSILSLAEFVATKNA